MTSFHEAIFCSAVNVAVGQLMDNQTRVLEYIEILKGYMNLNYVGDVRSPLIYFRTPYATNFRNESLTREIKRVLDEDAGAWDFQYLTDLITDLYE